MNRWVLQRKSARLVSTQVRNWEAVVCSMHYSIFTVQHKTEMGFMSSYHSRGWQRLEVAGCQASKNVSILPKDMRWEMVSLTKLSSVPRGLCFQWQLSAARQTFRSLRQGSGGLAASLHSAEVGRNDSKDL
jgi:hypothetical protein